MDVVSRGARRHRGGGRRRGRDGAGNASGPDIRVQGGVARMSDPGSSGTSWRRQIPVMAKCRIGHFVKLKSWEPSASDYVDESEVLTPAMSTTTSTSRPRGPVGLRLPQPGRGPARIGEGAAMIRTKGEPGPATCGGRAPRRTVLARSACMRHGPTTTQAYAKGIAAAFELVRAGQAAGAPAGGDFAAGVLPPPADAALMMQLGGTAFRGSGIFRAASPAKRAKAIVMATAQYTTAPSWQTSAAGLGAMVGINRFRIDG